MAIVKAAIGRGRSSITDIVPGTVLRHFLYKSKGNVQYVMPSYEPHYTTLLARRRLVKGPRLRFANTDKGRLDFCPCIIPSTAVCTPKTLISKSTIVSAMIPSRSRGCLPFSSYTASQAPMPVETLLLKVPTRLFSGYDAKKREYSLLVVL